MTVREKLDVKIVANLYNRNLKALHGDKISYDEWCKSILNNDTDEENFLICRGLMPVAWLKINGLENAEVGYISMLAVEPKYQYYGVGTFAVEFANSFLHDKGKRFVRVQTTADNLSAIGLYKNVVLLKLAKHKMFVVMKLNYAKSCLKSVFNYIGFKRILSKAFTLEGTTIYFSAAF